MRVAWFLCVACCTLLARTRIADAQLQDLGHRLPAGVGLDAGTQVDPGLYLGDRFVWFAADRIKDRRGEEVPVENFESDAYANGLGLAGTLKLDAVYVSAAIAIPLVKIKLSTDNPEASVERLGLGDVFVEPIKLGTRLSHVDVVASYSMYAPTTQGQRSGVGRPQWSHQFAAGGTVFFDDRRGWRLSALGSYVHYRKKQDIDITRGDSFLIQGGIGGRVFDGVVGGLAGYALWQVTDDSGADLPPPLRGARERAYGLGPELSVTLPALRSRITARWTWDIDGRARPAGTIFAIGISVVVWR